jgi:hypothetical protein
LSAVCAGGVVSDPPLGVSLPLSLSGEPPQAAREIANMNASMGKIAFFMVIVLQ